MQFDLLKVRLNFCQRAGDNGFLAKQKALGLSLFTSANSALGLKNLSRDLGIVSTWKQIATHVNV